MMSTHRFQFRHIPAQVLCHRHHLIDNRVGFSCIKDSISIRVVETKHDCTHTTTNRRNQIYRNEEKRDTKTRLEMERKKQIEDPLGVAYHSEEIFEILMESHQIFIFLHKDMMSARENCFPSNITS